MKKNFKLSQALVITGFLCFLVALLLANKKVDKKPETKVENHEHKHIDFWTLSDSVNASLDASTQNLIKEQSALAKEGNLVAFDTLVKIYSTNKHPVFASLWKEKKAEATRSSKDWTEAGTRFYVSSQFYPNYRNDLLDKAVHSLEKALEIDPANLDAKVKLSVCFVESGQEPMKGITLLREVLAADSNNIDAHLNLGLFAIQSGQYDKAIERFNKILSINPEYIEAYIYLGQTFANMGNKTKAIEILEKYKQINKDELINEQVNKYINELKNS